MIPGYVAIKLDGEAVALMLVDLDVSWLDTGDALNESEVTPRDMRERPNIWRDTKCAVAGVKRMPLR